MPTTAVIGAFLLAVYCTWNFASKLKSVNYLPGMRPPFSPLGIFGVIIPTCWWNPGLNWSWDWRKTIVRQLLKDERKTGLIKPPEMTSAVCFDLVWQQSASLYEDMVRAAKWGDERVTIVRDIGLYTRSTYLWSRQFALAVIARCGFGLPMPWSDPNVEKAEEEMSFSVAMEWVERTMIPWSVILPRWSHRLPSKWLRDMGHARSSLAEYMSKVVDKKARELSGVKSHDNNLPRGDIFARLINLDKEEVIGNTFSLMFAGHESSMFVLAATLGYLAIYQDEQEKAYQEILAATPVDRELGPEDVGKLTHTLACFHESARILPPGTINPRRAIEDITVNVTSPAPGVITIPKGSGIMIDLLAVHHNPEAFPDPDVWRPSRWYGAPEHDLTMFGYGSRVCVGRKFAQVEGACFLSHFLRDFKLDIELCNGETRKQYEERVMGNTRHSGLAFGVRSVDLKLIARK
ncbi:cytochrome P450 [Pisolithus orientalis]|uniref:cytochrome P450 n=1 Tax=Pisolithus orientalis TaxID=936130 RepID=UPI002225A1D9|nr:cytochrome P450 [Pisolithus orientalis]KAI6006203.1 cytochrome P450 [Pisolithus orientalis]